MTIVPFAISGHENTATHPSGHEENMLPATAARRFHDAVFTAMRALMPVARDARTDAACRHLLAAAYIVNGLVHAGRDDVCAARDVPPGESWAFRAHRTQRECNGVKD